MRLVLRAAGHPASKQLDLSGRNGFVRLGRRHALLRIFGRESEDHLTVIGLTWYDRFLPNRGIAVIEP